MTGVEDVILGRSNGGVSRRGDSTIVEGRIQSATASGATFTVPSWDKGRHVFGPAPWPMSRVEPTEGHDHIETTPPKGARCLVVFVGTGVSNPWILGWWS